VSHDAPFKIRLSDERRQRLVRILQHHFESSYAESLSEFRAVQLVDLCLRELGPTVYNQAIQDACAFMQDKLVDLEGEFYEPLPSDVTGHGQQDASATDDARRRRPGEDGRRT
jgi:uncharacterized protein (DUF2164 family)